MKVCDILSEEQHPASFWNMDPEQMTKGRQWWEQKQVHNAHLQIFSQQAQ